jgi:serine/threonine protein kinase
VERPDQGAGEERYGHYVGLVTLRGTQTAAAVEKLTSLLAEGYPLDDGDYALELIKVLGRTEDWADEETAELVDAMATRLADRELEVDELARWFSAHEKPEERPRVRLCVDLIPPSQVSVQKVLSLAGAQKIVFLCNWSVTDREIVLKQFVDNDMAKAVFDRELRLHPFSMEHPNIIDTHYFSNEDGDEFLAERFIETQSESWRSHGAFEATNLLHDLAAALQFVHQRGLIHGDVKPDNTGYDQGRYLLLDFGVCREAEAFAEGYGPTGTLRTRAPELVKRETTHTAKTDVWALAATVFHTLFGRYPLFDADESPPTLAEVEERGAFEGELEVRIDDEYDARVFGPVDAMSYGPLRYTLKRGLARDPGERASAEELAAECRSRIAAQTRASGTPTPLSSRNRVEQLREHLPGEEQMLLLPERKRNDLRAELRYLRADPGLTEQEKEEVKALEERASG